MIIKTKDQRPKTKDRKGQAMLLTVVILASVFLSASAIAGLLFIYELGQVSRVIDSAEAVFAADAAIDRALFAIFRCNPSPTTPSGWNLTNFDSILCSAARKQSPDANACSAAVTPGDAPAFCNEASYVSFIDSDNNPACGSGSHDPSADPSNVDCIVASGVSGKTARAFQIDF